LLSSRFLVAVVVLFGGLGAYTAVGLEQTEHTPSTGARTSMIKYGTTGKDTIKGTGTANDSFYGLAGDDYLDGQAGNDLLDGGTGADTLVGGLGIDTMKGGAGNDVYYVADVKDLIIEDATASGGIDTVFSTVSLTKLFDYVENATLQGTAASVTGNKWDNTLIGNGSNNVLAGAEGNDTLLGLDGADSLDGGVGNDLLDGGVGADTMAGGDGNDTYLVDSASDVVVERATNTGVDLIKTSASLNMFNVADLAGIDQVTVSGPTGVSVVANTLNNTLQGASGNDTLNGKEGNDLILGGDGLDRLWGELGNDTLDGGSADDELLGGKGDDVYYLDSAGDAVFEFAQEGSDTVYTYGDFDGSGGISEVEVIIGRGTQGLSLTGGDVNNTIVGTAGNDTLSGGAGINTLEGQVGDDTYFIDELSDVIKESSLNAGTDKAYVNVSGYALDDLNASGIEEVHLQGMDTDTLTFWGNASANRVFGYYATYEIHGGKGKDTILGNSGDDTLYGDEGDDRVVGYAGNNQLIGGVGNDNLIGGSDDDIIQGGADNDSIVGGAGYNSLYGDEGNDVVNGGADVDIIDGGDGLDLLHGMGGDDDLLGGAGADTLFGDEGADVLIGDAGNDLLFGGLGDDQLEGDAGNDSLNGGAGSDTYYFNAGFEADTISDTETAGLSVDVANVNVANYDKLWFSQTGNNLVVSVVGSADQVVVQDWFLSADAQIERFTDLGGVHVITNDSVNALVGVMALFQKQDMSLTNTPTILKSAIDQVWTLA
jgi:Ca2+-binding RTX toxin-like protein